MIDLRDVAGVVAILRDAVLLLEIVQIFLRQRLQVLWPVSVCTKAFRRLNSRVRS